MTCVFPKEKIPEANHAKQLETNQFLEEKLNYIHQNPVREGWVGEPRHYIYSSASNYAGEQGIIDVSLLL